MIIHIVIIVARVSYRIVADNVSTVRCSSNVSKSFVGKKTMEVKRLMECAILGLSNSLGRMGRRMSRNLFQI